MHLRGNAGSARACVSPSTAWGPSGPPPPLTWAMQVPPHLAWALSWPPG